MDILGIMRGLMNPVSSVKRMLRTGSECLCCISVIRMLERIPGRNG